MQSVPGRSPGCDSDTPRWTDPAAGTVISRVIRLFRLGATLCYGDDSHHGSSKNKKK